MSCSGGDAVFALLRPHGVWYGAVHRGGLWAPLAVLGGVLLAMFVSLGVTPDAWSPLVLARRRGRSRKHPGDACRWRCGTVSFRLPTSASSPVWRRPSSFGTCLRPARPGTAGLRTLVESPPGRTRWISSARERWRRGRTVSWTSRAMPSGRVRPTDRDVFPDGPGVTGGRCRAANPRPCLSVVQRHRQGQPPEHALCLVEGLVAVRPDNYR